jgi:4-amino-4-deoxy-L-arabinose transferase-like glycosyltransferase
MQIKKIDVNKILTIFLFAHIIIWTLVPSISNNNLPLDTIEALAWGSNLEWGFTKHPPLSAFSVKIFYEIFGSQDWAFYLLSQLFVASAFFIIFKFSEDFFKNKFHCLISIFLLEGIYFYNFTTPEFNVNVCLLPFWSLTVYCCWKGIKKNDIFTWLLFGFFAALGVLSKYLFIYLLLAIDLFFIYLILNKKFNFKSLLSLISFFLVLIPHIFWLIDNNFITLSYALHRTGAAETQLLDHFFNPSIFLLKQIGILLPLFFMLAVTLKNFKPKINFKEKKFLFLFIINIIPVFLILLTSLISGSKIRTMWMTPFYLFYGVLLVYIFQNQIILKRLKIFIIVFSTLFLLSPITYLYVSTSQKDKRTDYLGKEIANEIQLKWNNNFSNTIYSVIGDEWHAGNLSYHLTSNPKWYLHSTAFIDKSVDEFIETIGKYGFIIVNGECFNGVSFIIKNNAICMSGNK